MGVVAWVGVEGDCLSSREREDSSRRAISSDEAAILLSHAP